MLIWLRYLNQQIYRLVDSPTDWRTATRLPAATPPPLAIAADDIIPAAKDPAVMPPAVKPTNPSAAGTTTTAPTTEKTHKPQRQSNTIHYFLSSVVLYLLENICKFYLLLLFFKNWSRKPIAGLCRIVNVFFFHNNIPLSTELHPRWKKMRFRCIVERVCHKAPFWVLAWKTGFCDFSFYFKLMKIKRTNFS